MTASTPQRLAEIEAQLAAVTRILSRISRTLVVLVEVCEFETGRRVDPPRPERPGLHLVE